MELRKDLLKEILGIIEGARAKAIRSVDFERTLMYWKLGQKIFEEEQGGKDRAEYGAQLIKALAAELQPQFGSGFSWRQLYRYVQFYRMFPNLSALRTQFSWTHYKILISIENNDKREFYMAEAEKNNWTARQLDRQVNSLLFERLLMSNDVAGVLSVARNEQLPLSPYEIIKDPMVLEFLGLKDSAAYREHDLETVTEHDDLELLSGEGRLANGRVGESTGQLVSYPTSPSNTPPTSPPTLPHSPPPFCQTPPVR